MGGCLPGEESLGPPGGAPDEPGVLRSPVDGGSVDGRVCVWAGAGVDGGNLAPLNCTTSQLQVDLAQLQTTFLVVTAASSRAIARIRSLSVSAAKHNFSKFFLQIKSCAIH